MAVETHFHNRLAVLAFAAATGVLVFAALAPSLDAETSPKVVATIKPLHSLASQVMAGIGEPRLLVDGAQSPHHYALKPSDAAALNGGDVLFRVSPDLEAFTAKVVTSLPQSVDVVTLIETPGLRLLPRRGGSHGHDAKGTHHDSFWDAHIWLHPTNAQRIVEHMAEVLGKRFPEHAARFRENARNASAGIAKLDSELEQQLAPFQQKPFAVLHDAFRYFEDRYGLLNVAVVQTHDEGPPSAKHLSTVRHIVQEKGITCLVSDPQFDSRRLETVAEGSAAEVHVLDPEGVGVAKGASGYETLLRRLAKGFAACLGAD